MEWKLMNKSEARELAKKWEEMPEEEFSAMVSEWDDTILADCNDDYKNIRKDVLEMYLQAQEELASKTEYKNKADYYGDLFFALRFYFAMKKYGFDIRQASEDKIWIYLNMKVLPDIINKRFSKKDKRVNDDRYWKVSRRLYFKTLWWYIHLTLQERDTLAETIAETKKILMDNTTDEVVQIVERSGRAGYRVDVYREIMRYYGVDLQCDKKAKVLRKVMVLNTAKTSLLEPDLVAGGIKGYVKGLFTYFEG